MDDTSKYLIHADITADGVVERSDVVGAIFGQTEGLLGDELDLRDLQQSSKVGRIDVEIDSEAGQSHGTVTIASSLDKVETAILAASLETISRVGPCHATVDVTRIEDVRAAKRRAVVDRAKELLSTSFDESVMTSREILEEVRESVRVEDITEYEGLPAGPRVETSDAIVVVEGRADVLNLLRYGIKNAIAVEGTNVPDAVADLTQERNVTAFLDGDRGGELILRELAQVGHVDYVAFAPEGRSVEDLARQEVMSALRNKVDYDTLADESDIQSAVAATDGSAQPAPDADEHAGPASPPETDVPDGPSPPSADDVHSDDASDAPPTTDASAGGDAVPDVSEPTDGSDPAPAESVGVTDEGPTIEHVETLDDAPSEDGEDDAEAGGDVLDDADADSEPKTLRGHVQAVIDAGTGQVRLLDSSFDALTDAPAADAFDAVNDAESVPFAVVLDDELSQRVLDVAAQRGVEHVVARATGEFVKKPVGVRVRTAEELAAG